MFENEAPADEHNFPFYLLFLNAAVVLFTASCPSSIKNGDLLNFSN